MSKPQINAAAKECVRAVVESWKAVGVNWRRAMDDAIAHLDSIPVTPEPEQGAAEKYLEEFREDLCDCRPEIGGSPCLTCIQLKVILAALAHAARPDAEVVRRGDEALKKVVLLASLAVVNGLGDYNVARLTSAVRDAMFKGEE